MSTRLGLVLGIALVVINGTLATPGLSQAGNPIVLENQQAGTDQWQIPNSGFQFADDDSNQIKGYASATSVTRGGALDFFVTVNPAQTFTITFYRMGWYGGLGGRLMLQTAAISGVQQPACPVVDSATLLIACNWTSSYTLAVPIRFTDGVYLAVLSNQQGYQNYVPFVVRDDARQADLLYQQPVNTYQAYNSWGGKSLYTFNSTQGTRAYRVSFDRPYERDGSADYFAWEVYTVQWLERQGYNVTYTTDVDAEVNRGRMRSVKGVLIPGHSEYWTAAMYDAAQSARDAGVSLAFLGGDAIYWQARYEPAPGGAATRVLVCFKTSEPPNPVDPITATSPGLTTTLWQLSPVNRPEQTLMGIQSASMTGSTWDDTVNYVVTNSASWVYARTGFMDGSIVPGIVGYEADQQVPGVPVPTSRPGSAVLLAHSPYTDDTGTDTHQNSAIYQAPSGAWVFASGTHGWAWGLMRSGFVNAGIQQATSNVLDRFVNNPDVQPATATPTATSTPSPSPSPTAAPTGSATVTPSATAASTPTPTLTPTPSATPTDPPTSTPSPTPTPSPAPTDSATSTPSPTATPMEAATSTPTSTLTPTSTSTSTPTSTPTPTRTPAPTPSSTPTSTPTPVTDSSAYHAAVIADAPLTYWRLGESSGNVAADQRGAHNASYANGPSLANPGALFNDPATSAGFNGTTQYVQVPFEASLNPLRLSIEIWARPTGTPDSYRGLIASRNYPQGWALYLADTGDWEFWINRDTRMVTVAGGPARMNAWQHLVATCDGTTARLYVNGVAMSSSTVTNYQPQNANPLEIAQGETGTNFFFAGQLQEAALYGVALTPTQVQHHYSVGTTGR